MQHRRWLSTLRLTQGAALLGAAGLAAFLWAGPGRPPEPSAAVDALRSRLTGLSIHLLGYLQAHRPQSFEAIQTEGRAIRRVVTAYQPQLGAVNRSFAEGLGERYEEVRLATLAVLEADDQQANAQAEAAVRAAEALRILSSRRPAAGSAGRAVPAHPGLGAFLEAQAEARALALRLSGSSGSGDESMAGSERRFRKALRQFQALAADGGRGWKAEAQSRFEQAAAGARRSAELEQRKTELIQRYMAAVQAMERHLDQAPGTAPGRGSRRPGRLAGTLLLLAVAAALFRADRLVRRRIFGPLRQIIAATEAAASGDVTRQLDFWSHDEIGRLSQALNRLLTVLARSENLVYHLAALVELSGDAIISQNLDGTILSWNKGAQRIYGYAAEDVKGQPITRLAADEDGAEALRLVLERIRQGERVPAFESAHRAKNGRTVRALIRVAAILDSTKKLIGVSFCAQELGAGLPAGRCLETGDFSAVRPRE